MELVANQHSLRADGVRLTGAPPSLEGAAEWSANGPENRGLVMSQRGSIPPPSAKFGSDAL